MRVTAEQNACTSHASVSSPPAPARAPRLTPRPARPGSHTPAHPPACAPWLAHPALTPSTLIPAYAPRLALSVLPAPWPAHPVACAPRRARPGSLYPPAHPPDSLGDGVTAPWGSAPDPGGDSVPRTPDGSTARPAARSATPVRRMSVALATRLLQGRNQGLGGSPRAPGPGTEAGRERRRGRPHHGWRAAPSGRSVTGGQEALACSAFGFSSALDLSSALLAAATGAGLAAS